jgi:hypothetical protein
MKDVSGRRESSARQVKQWVASFTGHGVSFAVVRFLMGGILLAAATLKAELLFMSSIPPFASWSFGLVLFELAFAAWLFFGSWSSYAWWAAAGCFGFFAMVAGFKVLHGEADCGCFGVVRTPPWVSLSIDLTALACLAATYRGRVTAGPGRWAFVRRFPAAVGYALILLVVAKTGVTLLFAGGSAHEDMTFVDASQWVGRRFPLLESIDIGAELSVGEYVVVLHRHGCPLCEKTLSAPWFRDAASRWCDWGRIALIELPPYGDPGKRGDSHFPLAGRLNAPEPCLLPAPVVVLLQDGRVVSVATGEESPARLRELFGRSSEADVAGVLKLGAGCRESLAFLEVMKQWKSLGKT